MGNGIVKWENRCLPKRVGEMEKIVSLAPGDSEETIICLPNIVRTDMSETEQMSCVNVLSWPSLERIAISETPKPNKLWSRDHQL
jgi:hypothetical protein